MKLLMVERLLSVSAFDDEISTEKYKQRCCNMLEPWQCGQHWQQKNAYVLSKKPSSHLKNSSWAKIFRVTLHFSLLYVRTCALMKIAIFLLKQEGWRRILASWSICKISFRRLPICTWVCTLFMRNSVWENQISRFSAVESSDRWVVDSDLLEFYEKIFTFNFVPD